MLPKIVRKCPTVVVHGVWSVGRYTGQKRFERKTKYSWRPTDQWPLAVNFWLANSQTFHPTVGSIYKRHFHHWKGWDANGIGNGGIVCGTVNRDWWKRRYLSALCIYRPDHQCDPEDDSRSSDPLESITDCYTLEWEKETKLVATLHQFRQTSGTVVLESTNTYIHKSVGLWWQTKSLSFVTSRCIPDSSLAQSPNKFCNVETIPQG